ncbi:MAG: hypothetical protein KDA27_00365 [Candidatus Eisenbacteria bacterium]|uniref:Uncharacterized protein n=1 Tax=Eiseniibacteriota bacterium TaxID=2212470 RepID=A0A956SDE0_UNCEI|nr:hypothetical protein [Candidatus Eisenbacteria bacterium]MCB9463000.1 hypothetical protein [Candidatus Eisenbacteria bacterium]
MIGWVGLQILQPIVLLWHELGHWIPAALLTRGPVGIELGESPRGFAWGRFSLRATPTARTARTSYDPGALGRWGRTIVAIGGPMATTLGAWLGGSLALDPSQALWLRFSGVVVAWAHIRVLLFTCLPTRGQGESQIGARGADWRDLHRIWASKRGP